VSRLLKAILRPHNGDPAGGHLSDEDLASLAEGAARGDERERLVSHVNRCERCFRVLSETLANLEETQAKTEKWWSRRSGRIIAAAASLIMVVMVGHTVLYYQSVQESSTVSPVPEKVELQSLKHAAPKSDKKAAEPVKPQSLPAKPQKAKRYKMSPVPVPESGGRGILKDMAEAPSPPDKAMRGVLAKRAPRSQPSIAKDLHQASPKSERMNLSAPPPQSAREGSFSASLPIDSKLHEEIKRGWRDGWKSKDDISRLLKALEKRGLKFGDVRKVVMLSPVSDSTSDQEILKISANNGILYLRVAR
jgi:hypothetical protein